MNEMLDRFNAVCGIFVAIFTAIFGTEWIIFCSFLVLNIIDWITGWLKSRIKKTENSKKGLQGLLKKLGYWLMIAVAFIMSSIFIQIGETIGVNLTITTSLGFFVLASLIVNEIRSILENLVEAGYDVPKILIKGLKVADEALNQNEDDLEN